MLKDLHSLTKPASCILTLKVLGLGLGFIVELGCAVVHAGDKRG
jgi:hypothetical protein